MSVTIKLFLASYWQTLFCLYNGRNELKRTLDLPLKTASFRSLSFSAWTTVWVFTSLSLTHPPLLSKLISHLGAWMWIIPLPLWIIGTLSLYGLVRIYVLISHLIATILFKARGQRLRWLNEQTTILAMSFPLSIAFTVVSVNPWLADILIGGLSLYVVILSSFACKNVFHREKWRGLLFLFALNVVTWFVLAMCSIALFAALFILGIIMIPLVRIFYR